MACCPAALLVVLLLLLLLSAARRMHARRCREGRRRVRPSFGRARRDGGADEAGHHGALLLAGRKRNRQGRKE